METAIPSHVALIMDGNRRWARMKGFPPVEGHKVGEKVIEPIVLRCQELGILAVSFYTLSRENLKRPREEVNALLDVLRTGAGPMLGRLAKGDIRFVPLGDLDLFPDDIRKILLKAANETKHKNKLTVNLALAYDGRDEITRAMKKLNEEGFFGDAITEELISSRLDTSGQPDPELVIRTGGRSRLSGYLSWQTALSEIYFSPTLWPDFTVKEFDIIINWYGSQVRTFGR